MVNLIKQVFLHLYNLILDLIDNNNKWDFLPYSLYHDLYNYILLQ